MSKYLGDFTVTYYDERINEHERPYIYLELCGPFGNETAYSFRNLDENLQLLNKYDTVSVNGYRKDGNFISVQSIRMNVNDLYKHYIERLDNVLDSVTDVQCINMINKLLTDKNFFGRFITVPASLNGHHAFIGGLLAHTVEAMEYGACLFDKLSSERKIDKSVLLTGLFLHDVGKTLSFEIDGFDLKMADVGWQIDHATLGIRILERKFRNKFTDVWFYPVNLYDNLSNIILSHHNKSRVKPATPEAYVVKNIDNFSAGLDRMEA